MGAKKVPYANRIGEKHCRLFILELVPGCPGTLAQYICQCDCGQIVTLNAVGIVSGSTKSCGCHLRERVYKATSLRHGLSHTRIHNAWLGMRARCQNPNSDKFSYYGGRGIKVCDRWQVFENFLADMGQPDEGMSLDRIDGNGDYCAENCRWADKKCQSRNRRSAVTLEMNGKSQCLSAWAEETGLPYNSLKSRLKHGWSIEEALTTPILKNHGQQSRSRNQPKRRDNAPKPLPSSTSTA